jgi:hypothetical protein
MRAEGRNVSTVIQLALRASLFGREIVLLNSLIDGADHAAIKTALEVWHRGEQSQIRLPRQVWRRHAA